MRNKIRGLLIFFSLLFCLSACGSEEKINDARISDNLRAPEINSLPFEGIWEITEIKKSAENEEAKADYKLGDQLLIDKDLVALGNSIAIAPSFSSKYVNTKDYMNMRFINEISLAEEEKSLFIYMIRDSDIFSLDLFKLDNDKIGFHREGKLYILQQKNEIVPQLVKDRYIKLAKEQKGVDGKSTSSSYLMTLIGVREPQRSNEGYLYYDYSSYLICDMPDQKKPLIYKIDKLFLPSDDKHINILEYKPIEPDDNNGIMIGQYSFYSVDDLNKENSQVLNDRYGRNISYAHNNIVSFDMPAAYPPDNKTRTEYELHFLDQLSSNHPLDVLDIGGKTEKEAMLNQIVAQRNFLNLKESDLDESLINYSNLGIERRNTDWTFVSSINWKQSRQEYPSKINLDLVPSIPFFDISLEKPVWSRITNKQPLAQTASRSPAGERMIIKTDDELHYYKLFNQYIADDAIFSIQLEAGSKLIDIEYFYDEKAEKIMDVFLSLDQSQPHFISSDRHE